MPEITNSATSQQIDEEHDEPGGDDEGHLHRGIVRHRLSEGRGIQFLLDFHMFLPPDLVNDA